jgi:hypothetical protein
MARSKKKTLSQNVVNVATTGMPKPIRKVLGRRIVALLIVLLAPVLYASGIISIKWENGRPHFAVNRQRAAQVKQEATEKIQTLRDDHGTFRAPAANIPPLVNRQSNRSR